MPIFSLSHRIKIALGGFASFIGAIVLVCAILIVTGSVDTLIFLQNPSALFLALTVATLDIACGLLLVFADRKIVFSFASKKKKTHNDTSQTG